MKKLFSLLMALFVAPYICAQNPLSMKSIQIQPRLTGNGTLILEATGGTPDAGGRYTYGVGGNLQTAIIGNFTNVIPGLEFWFVTDSEDSFLLGEVFFIESGTSSARVSLVPPTCNASGTGQISLSLVDPTSAGFVVYQVFDPQGNLVATGTLQQPFTTTLNLPASPFYNIQLLLNNPGVQAVPFQFNGTPFGARDTIALVTGYPLSTKPTCGLPNGSIQVQVANGSGSYTATAVGQKGSTHVSSPSPFGDTSVSTFTNLSEDIYTITISDTNGCSTLPSTVNLPNETNVINLTIDAITPPACANGNGSVFFSVAGGTAPYSACLTPVPNPTGCSPQPIGGAQGTVEAAPGSYVLFVTDSGGCSADSTSFTIPQFTPSGVPLPDYILNKYCCVSL